MAHATAGAGVLPQISGLYHVFALFPAGSRQESDVGCARTFAVASPRRTPPFIRPRQPEMTQQK